jgi:hypothetical protein
VYKGCTRDAHRVYQLKPHDLPVGIPCTPLVHGLKAGGGQGIWLMEWIQMPGKAETMIGDNRIIAKLYKNSQL